MHGSRQQNSMLFTSEYTPMFLLARTLQNEAKLDIIRCIHRIRLKFHGRFRPQFLK